MGAWLVAGIATTIFLSLYDSEDFRERLNMKIPKSTEYKLTIIAVMVLNGIFCYIWEVGLLRFKT